MFFSLLSLYRTITRLFSQFNGLSPSTSGLSLLWGPNWLGQISPPPFEIYLFPGPGKPEIKYIDNTAHFATNKHHQELITIVSQ